MQELLIYRCTSNYNMTWVMSICSFKGILLIFGVFLAWETRNVHYPSLNDSKNIGLAVYNVFMFSCLALVVEFVVTYPPLKMLVGRSIVLVGTTSTISLLFVPKVRKCRLSSKAIFQSNKTIIKAGRWPIHIINSVDKTKLSCNTHHRRSATVSLETSFFTPFISFLLPAPPHPASFAR